MSRLNDIAAFRALDRSDMYGAIAGFPDQIRRAVEIARRVKTVPDNFKNVSGMVLCGMGGSAIGGDLARSLLQDSLPFPFQICRHYNLPAWCGKDALVVASSYSGNTEETLAAFDQARQKKCRLIVLTCGGKLKDAADAESAPVIVLPLGLQPRAALGYSFVPLMLILNHLGFSPHDDKAFERLAAFLERRRQEFAREGPTEKNLAKQTAEKLFGRIPIIYSGPQTTDAVGVRIKGQICENAKMLAFANQFPEFNHNELVGWQPVDFYRQHLIVLILRDVEDHPRVSARMDIVKQLLEKQGVETIEIHSVGENRLERIFSLIQFGDFLSFYLAMLGGVDPTPVEPIEHLKRQLAALK